MTGVGFYSDKWLEFNPLSGKKLFIEPFGRYIAVPVLYRILHPVDRVVYNDGLVKAHHHRPIDSGVDGYCGVPGYYRR